MKISELTTLLERVKSTHGDIDVTILDSDTQDVMAPVIAGFLESGKFALHGEYWKGGAWDELFSDVLWRENNDA